MEAELTQIPWISAMTISQAISHGLIIFILEAPVVHIAKPQQNIGIKNAEFVIFQDTKGLCDILEKSDRHLQNP